MRVRIATRGSALARWQAEHVAGRLRAAGAADVELVIVETLPDRRLDLPLWELGGKGLFVKEVQAAVLDGRADVAVHSGKDLPALTPDALVIAAVPERADARDALVGGRLGQLAPGAVVATGSGRRRAQLAWARPDLGFTGLRGNIATRLARLDEGGADAIVVAVAALERLGLTDRITEVLEPATMLPQVAQGALAVEVRGDAAGARLAGVDPGGDGELRALVGSLDHPPSRRAFEAERAFLAELGGDCDLPAGCHATPVAGDGADPGSAAPPLRVEGLLASLDGHVVLRHVMSGADGPILGRAVARHLLDHGGGALLDR